MKLISLILAVLIIGACTSSSPIENEELDASYDQCDVCSNFVDYIIYDETNAMPIQFIELLDFERFKEVCMDTCGFTNDDLDTENDARTSSDTAIVDSVGQMKNLITLAGCDTCKKIISVTAMHSHGLEFSSLKYALRHACEDIKGILDTVKCKLFIKLRESKILQVIYKHRLDAHGSCVELQQCQ